MIDRLSVPAVATLLAGGALLVGCDSRSPETGEHLSETRAGATLATPGFVETTVISGLDGPTVVRFASDGRVFVAQKDGRILVYDDLNDTVPTTFIDLDDHVHNFWDRGLLGMTLDPAFPTRPYVYVLYAYDGDPGGAAPKWGDQCPTPPGATGDGCVISGRLSRFTANGNVASSETVLVEGWRQQYPSHATGQVEFGPEGALYASGGDGASFNFVDYGQDGDPLNPLADPPVPLGSAQTPPSALGGALRAQSARRPAGPVLLNGTVIRVNPDTGLGLPDNPLAASADVNARRIVAYGLRNPFRIAARPGKNEMWVADVGWNDWEELNRIQLGAAQPFNFGWPCYEGIGKQSGYDAADLTSCESLYSGAGQTAPYFTYKHTAHVSMNDACRTGNSSVTGLAFYTGSSYPAEYASSLFFADYSRGCIYVMGVGPNGDPDPLQARSFHTNAGGPVFLTTGPGGDLFYVAHDGKTVQRISYLQPAASFTATPAQGQVPLIVRFDGTGSVKPLPGDVLEYAWDLDGDGDFDDSDDAAPTELYETVGDYSVRLKVTDQRGTSNISAPLVVKATAEPPIVSTPPVVVIDTPRADSRWNVGDVIQFTGHATDAEDGPLPASALTWHVLIQHCPDGCHVHDLLTFEAVSSGSVVAEDHDYPMHLELMLTATDSSGQQRTVRLPLEPNTVSLTFDTAPSNLDLVVGPTAQTTPFVRRVLHGSENSVSVPLEQTLNGTLWRFQRWSDALPPTHQLAPAVAPARYVATYAPAGGLTGQYFDDLGFASPVLTRLDPMLDFDWATGSPDPSVGADTFSVRWTGEVKIDFDEIYTFSTRSDDGVRLLIDDTTVIDHFDAHSPAADQGWLALTAGWHRVLLEYFEDGGGAELSLSWSSPSQAEQVVPESHLRPGCDVSGVCSGGLGCVNGSCTPSCDPARCKGANRCRLGGGGGCVKLCVGVTCPAGEKCDRGQCDGGAGGNGGAGGATGENPSAGASSGGVAGTGAPGNGGSDPGGDGASGSGGGSGGSEADMEGGRAALGGEAGGAPEASAGSATDPDGGAGAQTSGGASGAGAGSGGEATLAEAGAGGGSAALHDSHCSCRAPGSERARSPWWPLAGLALLFGRRRRR